MKTILHTIDTNEPGGAETVFIDLATQLPKDQYRSVIVIQGEGWICRELRKRGAEPVLLDTRGSFNWDYLKGLISLVRSEKVDLIQSHLLGANVYCSLAGLLTRTPVVAVFHGAVDIDADERFKAVKFGVINAGAGRIIAVSKSLRDNIIQRTRLRSDRTEVIYNGIKTINFQQSPSTRMRDQYGWGIGDIIVGSLGNMHVAKGYDVLLRAAALLKHTGKTYRFVVAGQVQQEIYDDLLKLKSELELDDVIYFTGFVDDPSDFLSGIDLFLLPSITEGFSIVTIQAMAAGLPVVATRSGGPEEIITHGLNGWLVEPGNPEAIAEAVQVVMSDPVLTKRISQEGRLHTLQTFELNTMLDAYKGVYDSLLP
jgi:glycosyltransferase involved in cell wall biosynthesis